ncbi:MAG: hypothetical protein OEY59_07640 [Deltaproteobacteria bacterium]|nr:hypothetical protein [Deltaproteobacteria bacterium]
MSGLSVIKTSEQVRIIFAELDGSRDSRPIRRATHQIRDSILRQA